MLINDDVFMVRTLTDKNGVAYIAAEDVVKYLKICEEVYEKRKTEIEASFIISTFEGGLAVLYVLEKNFKEYIEERRCL